VIAEHPGRIAQHRRHGHQLAAVAIRFARPNAASTAQPCVAINTASAFASQAPWSPADALANAVRSEPADHLVAADPPRPPENPIAWVWPWPPHKRREGDPQHHEHPSAAGLAPRCRHDAAVAPVPPGVDTGHGCAGRPCEHAAPTADCPPELAWTSAPSHVSFMLFS
jgi:hypothetical protein